MTTRRLPKVRFLFKDPSLCRKRISFYYSHFKMCIILVYNSRCLRYIISMKISFTCVREMYIIDYYSRTKILKIYNK